MTGGVKLDLSAILARATPLELIAEKQVGEAVALSGKGKYQYCPYCRERLRHGGLDGEIKPLLSVLYKQLCREQGTNRGTVLFERRYECQTCKNMDGTRRSITIDDFSATIGGIAFEKQGRQEESHFFDLSDEEIERHGFMYSQKPPEKKEFETEEEIFDYSCV